MYIIGKSGRETVAWRLCRGGRAGTSWSYRAGARYRPWKVYSPDTEFMNSFAIQTWRGPAWCLLGGGWVRLGRYGVVLLYQLEFRTRACTVHSTPYGTRLGAERGVVASRGQGWWALSPVIHRQPVQNDAGEERRRGEYVYRPDLSAICEAFNN